MNKVNLHHIAMGLLGLLVTWQATNFSLNYRAILSSVIASGLAGASIKSKEPTA